jgi:hypothetical protein
LHRKISGQREDIKISLMVGNENLWPVRENIFQAVNFNIDTVQFAKKSAPEPGYSV